MSRPPRRNAKQAAPLPEPAPPARIAAPVLDSPVPLEHPVEYGGKTYAQIIRRRPDSGVLGRWFEQFQERTVAGEDTYLNVPIFVDETGERVPDAVIGALDDDDRETVFRDTEPFFPRRLSAALEALTQGSAPSGGEPAEPRSSE